MRYTCTTCSGSGRMMCGSCYGHCCPQCNHQGKWNCQNCNGRGYFEYGDSPQQGGERPRSGFEQQAANLVSFSKALRAYPNAYCVRPNADLPLHYVGGQVCDPSYCYDEHKMYCSVIRIWTPGNKDQECALIQDLFAHGTMMKILKSGIMGSTGRWVFWSAINNVILVGFADKSKYWMADLAQLDRLHPSRQSWSIAANADQIKKWLMEY